MLKSIEFFRFLFSILIVYLHVFPQKLPYAGINFSGLKLYLIVEFFFIISGFFLYLSITKAEKNGENFKNYFINRLLRLYPIILIVNILTGEMFISKIFLLPGTGLTYKFTFAWYVGPLLLVSTFYTYIVLFFKKKYVEFTIALLIYFSYLYLTNIDHGIIDFHIQTYLPFFSAGTLRAIGGIGIGYFIGKFYKSYKINKNCLTIKNINITYITFSIVQTAIIYILIKNIFFKPFHKSISDIEYIIYFVILFITLINKLGILNTLFERNFSVILGRYAYAIYIMQILSFHICDKFIHPILSEQYVSSLWILKIVLAVLFGVISYHLVESKLYNKYKRSITKIKAY